jgi:DNA-binding GntR family transcriptional regulator
LKVVRRKKLGQIKRTSLSGQAIKKLKERILSGLIPPGSRLIADDIARELGISRTPVRDALSKLASVGLLIYNGKSHIVAGYSAKDVKELYAMRTILEVYAIREAVLRLTPSQISQFRHSYERVEKRIRKEAEDISLMIKLDTDLHQLVYTGSGNERLGIILQDIREKLSLIHSWGRIVKRAKYTESAKIDEFREFLSALESRDVEIANNLMKKHLAAGEEFSLECLGFSEKTQMPPKEDSVSLQSKEKKQ